MYVYAYVYAYVCLLPCETLSAMATPFRWDNRTLRGITAQCRFALTVTFLGCLMAGWGDLGAGGATAQSFPCKTMLMLSSGFFFFRYLRGPCRLAQGHM